ncbi:hypothetical protein CKAH01_11148 [Colletotrichum kahawae]|uniref:Uncharacterized protein n=1 Tax=Colletotrichum kahawae TaxID=34407 RepID=A0AAE0CXZ4_COLKA|nr:hypothetical protein CKAH01_11148 [Colletotrichum kahawae]
MPLTGRQLPSVMDDWMTRGGFVCSDLEGGSSKEEEEEEARYATPKKTKTSSGRRTLRRAAPQFTQLCVAAAHLVLIPGRHGGLDGHCSSFANPIRVRARRRIRASNFLSVPSILAALLLPPIPRSGAPRGLQTSGRGPAPQTPRAQTAETGAASIAKLAPHDRRRRREINSSVGVAGGFGVIAVH